MPKSIADFADLTAPQRAILERLEAEERFTERFYFTGGTLLKALGIVPRESNDLDFFTFPGVEGRAYMESLNATRKILRDMFGESNVKVTERGFLLPDARTTVECVYDIVHAIDDFISFGRLRTSGLKDFAANKSAAFCVRDEVKDYIDLAFLTKREGWLLADLAELAEDKFGMQTIYEEKLLTEFLNKRDTLSIPPEIFLRDPQDNIALVEEQVEFLLRNTSL